MIASPLRLSRLTRKKRVKLETVKFLVLDEADKLLELKDNPHTVSHVHQVDKIMAACTNPDLVRPVSQFQNFLQLTAYVFHCDLFGAGELQGKERVVKLPRPSPL